jgi:hypothetical protein
MAKKILRVLRDLRARLSCAFTFRGSLFMDTRPRIARERVPPAKADSPSLLVCGAGSLAAIVSEHMPQASVPSRLCETAHQDE